MQYRKENDHLIISNRAKCKEILWKQQRSQEDIIDFLVSLHLVLEISLHTFYRHIILLQIKKNIPHIDVAQNLDNISFWDKTALFFYLSVFDFQWNEARAEHFHKAIGMIKNFCETRNKLLHGHMVWELVSGDWRKKSRAYELATEENMKHQIERFKFIIDAVSFYYGHLQKSFWEGYKNEYLRCDFLD